MTWIKRGRKQEGRIALLLLCGLLFALLSTAKFANAAELVMAISNGSGMPMTDIRGEELRGGILKELSLIHI